VKILKFVHIFGICGISTYGLNGLPS